MEWSDDHETQGDRSVALRQLRVKNLSHQAGHRTPNELRPSDHALKERRPTPTVLPDPLQMGESTQRIKNANVVSFQQSTLPADVEGDGKNVKKNSSPDGNFSTWEKIFSWRYATAVLLGLSWVMTIALRDCLSLAIVCMVRTGTSTVTFPFPEENGTMSIGNGSFFFNRSSFQSDTSGIRENVSSSVDGISVKQLSRETYEFDWTTSEQGLVLSSIFFTSFLAPLVGNALEGFMSPKWVVTTGFAYSGLLTVLSPLAARLSPYALAVVRILLGFAVGGSNVSVVGYYLARWAPEKDRLFMVTITYSGVSLGGVLVYFTSGLLCSVPVDNGWPFVFYFFGALAFLYCLAWHFLSAPSPEEHPFISEKEKAYILANRTGIKTSDEGQKKERPPYCTILTSVPVIAFLITVSVHMIILNTIFTVSPMYLNDALGFSTELTGVLVSIVAFVRLLGSYGWSAFSSVLMSRFNVPIPSVRKLTLLSGYSLSVAFLIAQCLTHEYNRWFGYSFLLIAMFCQSVANCVLPTIPLDMAPKYAGLLSGMFVFVGNLVSIGGPAGARALTTNDLISEWTVVFYILSGLQIVSNFVFFFFGQARLQPWAIEIPGTPRSHIVSPFITMGRRFSALIEAPVFTPSFTRKTNNERNDVTAQSSRSPANRRAGQKLQVGVSSSAANENPGYVRTSDESVANQNGGFRFRVERDDGLKFEHIPDIDDPSFEIMQPGFSRELNISGAHTERLELRPLSRGGHENAAFGVNEDK